MKAKHPGGRKRLAPEKKAQSRSVTLYPHEWAILEAADADGNAVKEAARRLRMTMENHYATA